MVSHLRVSRKAKGVGAAVMIAVSTGATLLALAPAGAVGEPADGGLVVLGEGYRAPTGYTDAFNALAGKQVVALAQTDEHTCALDTNGAAACWGLNPGQLGIGAVGSGYSFPAHVRLEGVGDPQLIDIDAGVHHTCGVGAGGRAFCWGHDNAGRLGNGPSEGDAPTPGKVDTSRLPTDLRWSQSRPAPPTPARSTTAGRRTAGGRPPTDNWAPAPPTPRSVPGQWRTATSTGAA